MERYLFVGYLLVARKRYQRSDGIETFTLTVMMQDTV